MLHVREVIPVHAGPLTLYYPKWIPGEHGPDGPIVALTGLHFAAGGKDIPWQRDLLDVFTFHVDIPAGVTQLNAAYDFIEPDGYSATDKLIVLEWNEVALYPAGTPSAQLTYDATLILPDGWKFGTSLPIDTPVRQSRLLQAHLASISSSIRPSSPANTIASSTSRRPASRSTTNSTSSPTAKPRSTSRPPFKKD